MRSFLLPLVAVILLPYFGFTQQISRATNSPSSQVNVFLGSSGDHGQLSPAASYPFSLLSIAPLTYPTTHTGYEYLAKKFYGFTHNRFEGVGCQGSGGVLLLKPFLGKENRPVEALIRQGQKGSPGQYSVTFTNGISNDVLVYENLGRHRLHFPQGDKGVFLDLGYALNGTFVAEEHRVGANSISGWVSAKTTCHVGTYRYYYYLEFDAPVSIDQDGHQVQAHFLPGQQEVGITLALSSVSEEQAKARVVASRQQSFASQLQKSSGAWDELLGRIQVKGDPAREKLFYSLLYRTLQSPYIISEPDGSYRTIDGSLKKSTYTHYHGWAIWDNYKTQLPLLSLAYPDRFTDIAKSIANLYPYGKKDFAGPYEPANTVRTEHAVVVLLDAYRKGVDIGFDAIRDSLIAEVDRLDFSKPDKALEACYDSWALGQLLKLNGDAEGSKKYLAKAATYTSYWQKDFNDLTKNDVDRMSARSMYQGTIRQYRWAVPFDQKGLIRLAGGEEAYLRQLDDFFDNDYYNRANEPDLQTPAMYDFTSEPWKSQYQTHKIAVDTVIQHYFNDNSRGIGSFIDVIYKNEPKAYIRTMDDDAGAMSGWFVWAGIGLYPACVGEPVYYVHVPLFPEVTVALPSGKKLVITVTNFGEKKDYIKSIRFNGKDQDRNWLSHEEIMKGGQLTITATSNADESLKVTNPFITSLAK